MYRRILLASALAGTLAVGLAVAPAASANNSWSVSIGAPGFAVGYSNYGHYGRSYVYAAPPVVYGPPVAYYGDPYAGYPAVYGPRVVYARPYVYHRPYWRAHYGYYGWR